VVPATLDAVRAVAGTADLAAARAEVDDTSATDEVIAYVAALVRKTRDLPAVALRRQPARRRAPAGRVARRSPIGGPRLRDPDDVGRMPHRCFATG